MSLFNIFKSKDTDELSQDTQTDITDELINFCSEKLSTTLELSGMDSEITASVINGNCIYLDVESHEDSGRIIGRNGNMIEALQILIKAMVFKEYKQPVQLLIDVGGYVERRIESAKEEAIIASRRLSTDHSRQELKPMPPSERRAVHIEFKNNRNIRSFSVGEGSNRHIVLEYQE